MKFLKYLLFLLITSVSALHAACAEKTFQNLVAAPTKEAIIARAIARNKAAAQDKQSGESWLGQIQITALPAVATDIIAEYAVDIAFKSNHRVLAPLDNQRILIQWSPWSNDLPKSEYPIKIYNPTAPEKIQELPITMKDQAQGLKLNDGTIVICSPKNKFILDVDKNTTKNLDIFEYRGGKDIRIYRIYELPQGDTIIIVYSEDFDHHRHAIMIVNLKLNCEVTSLSSRKARNSIAVFNNGNFIAPPTIDDCCELYNSNGNPIKQNGSIQFPPHPLYPYRLLPDYITAVDDGKIASCFYQGGSDVQIWDPQTGAILHTITHGDNQPIHCFEKLNDKLLLTRSGSVVKIWDVKTGENVRTYRIFIGEYDTSHRPYLDSHWPERAYLSGNYIIITTPHTIITIMDPMLEQIA